MGDYNYSGTPHRSALLFFSLLICLSGGAILGVAVWAAVTIAAFPNILGTSAGIFASVYIMIAVGSVLFLGSMFGCLSIVVEKKNMVLGYAAVLALVFLLQLVGSVLAFVYYPIARDAAHSSIEFYNTDLQVERGWDSIQGVLECCGVNYYTDWKQRVGTTAQPNEVFPKLPNSCCSDKVQTCSENSLTNFKIGCNPKLQSFFVILGGIGFGVLVVEILTLAVLGSALRGM
ncbi:tetraspanin-9-like [Ciona intestinalis]